MVNAIPGASGDRGQRFQGRDNVWPGYDSRWGISVNVVAAIRDLIDEFRLSYVIQYTPQNVSAGGWHEVVVRVKGVDPRGVRTRAGYFDADR